MADQSRWHRKDLSTVCNLVFGEIIIQNEKFYYVCENMSGGDL